MISNSAAPLAQLGTARDEPDRMPTVQAASVLMNDGWATAATAHVVADRRFGWRTHDFLRILDEEDFVLGEVLHEG
jgi:hypothetical protein